MLSRFNMFPTIINIDDDYDDYCSNVFDVVSDFFRFPSSLMPQPYSGLRSQRRPKSDSYVLSIGVGTFYDLKDIKTEMHDDKLKVSGTAKETLKHGVNQHQFEREYDIPEDVDLSTLKTRLTTDGTLRITFQRKHVEPKKELEYLSNDQEFRVRINMEGFKPEEMSIRVVDRDLVIEATRKSHTVNPDGTKTQSSSGYISRTIRLGDDVEIDHLRAVNSNGSIEVSAPRDPQRAIKTDRKLEIEQK
ncbi:Alpha-crystallin B chain [Thelohanellus kitauei]|uniref:Alpha-crystallin B chain n=1 Tax=Thelohanellus kitauei TaxID=669202 RepID=A0A0C2MCP5_THEKT|nr:Alpha-crystallin B chain [Thelohanellus kitauei]